MPTALPTEKANSLAQSITAGEKPADIAKKLKISVATVYKHMRARSGSERPPTKEANASKTIDALRAENDELRRILGDMLVDSKLERRNGFSKDAARPSPLVDTQH